MYELIQYNDAPLNAKRKWHLETSVYEVHSTNEKQEKYTRRPMYEE